MSWIFTYYRMVVIIRDFCFLVLECIYFDLMTHRESLKPCGLQAFSFFMPASFFYFSSYISPNFMERCSYSADSENPNPAMSADALDSLELQSKCA